MTRHASESGGFVLGLRREAAARAVGISPNKFDQFVRDGILPAPRVLGGIKLWDRRDLESAFDGLPVDEKNAAKGWDQESAA